MKVKRLLALVLVLALTAVVGCSGNKAPESTAPAAPESSAPAAPESSAPAAPAAWEPKENLEVVVGSGAGGGADVFTRKAVSIIEENGWYPKNINVVNKPGSGHVVGYTYLMEQKSDYVMNVTSSSFYAQPISGNSPLTFDDFSYLVLLCKDPSLLVASPQSGFKTLDDVIAYAKEHPGEVMCGGSNSISDDAILTNQMNNEYDCDITYVTLESGSDAITAVMGGHVQLAFGSPSEIGDNVAAGNAVAIAVASDTRLDYAGLEDVPTFLELGHDINHQQHRGFVMSKDASPEAVEYFSDLFLKVSETQEWKDFLKENCMNEFVKDSQGYKDYMPELIDIYTFNIEDIQSKMK